MNEKRLKIYLNDHLAMMVAELELASRCRRSNRQTIFESFLLQLQNELKAQKSIAQDIIRRVAGKESLEGRLKKNAAWFAVKLGQLKLNDSLLKYSPLSRVYELEALTAAAQERVVFWDNFDAIGENGPRLDGITFSFFRDQSQRHIEQLNSHRRAAAKIAFTNRTPSEGDDLPSSDSCKPARASA